MVAVHKTKDMTATLDKWWAEHTDVDVAAGRGDMSRTFVDKEHKHALAEQVGSWAIIPACDGACARARGVCVEGGGGQHRF